jgi:molybdopterin-guanine dinucleotide biosynthesis protein B
VDVIVSARLETPVPVVGVVGWKNSGKTTLAVALIAEFTRRGLKVASVKHAHHGFQIDEGETDSARHRRAGAAEVAIVSNRRWAIVHELADDEDEPDFPDVLAWLAPCDLVVVEGYKSAAIPKIEARRLQSSEKTALSDRDPNIIAIAADHGVDAGALPVFDLDDVAGIVDFLADRLGLSPRRAEA